MTELERKSEGPVPARSSSLNSSYSCFVPSPVPSPQYPSSSLARTISHCGLWVETSQHHTRHDDKCFAEATLASLIGLLSRRVVELVRDDGQRHMSLPLVDQ